MVETAGACTSEEGTVAGAHEVIKTDTEIKEMKDERVKDKSMSLLYVYFLHTQIKLILL